MYFELDILRNFVPEILNGLSQDDLYKLENGSEPPRNSEVLQSWEAIKYLIKNVIKKDHKQSLKNCLRLIDNASVAYDKIIESQLVQLDSKSNSDHIEPLREGIELFSKLAEIDLADD